MSTTSGRERVVRRYDQRGVLCAAFALGLVLGLAVVRIELYLASNAVTTGWWAPVVFLHVVLGCHAGVAIMLSRVSGSARLAALAAVLINLGMFLSGTFDVLVGQVGFGAAATGHPVSWQAAVALAVTSCIAAGVALAARWVFRMLRYVPIEQTCPPRLCVRCAYEMGESDPCPECGTLRADARARGSRIDAAWFFAQRTGPFALAVLLLAGAAYGAYRVWTDYLPTRRFISQFAAAEPAYAYIDAQIATRGRFASYVNSVGRSVNLADGSGRMILVSFNGNPPPGLPVMQVRICAAATLPPGWPVGAERMTDWGLPNTVVADLDREQAERVIRDGLPPGLVEAIVAKADEIGWKAGGGMQNVGGARLLIDAERYFTNSQAGSSAPAPAP